VAAGRRRDAIRQAIDERADCVTRIIGSSALLARWEARMLNLWFHHNPKYYVP